MGRILLKNYFVVSGYGENNASPILAFDNALKEAGIHQVNLVGVSSMLPLNARRIKFSMNTLKIGEIVFCVLARVDGRQGHSLRSGIGVAMGYQNSIRKKYGFVLEVHTKNPKNNFQESLAKGLDNMAKTREFIITKKELYTGKSHIVSKRYGSCIVALIYR